MRYPESKFPALSRYGSNLVRDVLPDNGEGYGNGNTVEDWFGSAYGIGHGDSGAGTLSGYGGASIRWAIDGELILYEDDEGVIDGYGSGEANCTGCGYGYGGANGSLTLMRRRRKRMSPGVPLVVTDD